MFRFLSLAVVVLALAPFPVQAAERNVVMILIDGLPAYLLDDPQASLPVIRGLAGEGVVATAGMHVSDPSITWPNQTTLVTGSHPDRHGVLFNGGLERFLALHLNNVDAAHHRYGPKSAPGYAAVALNDANVGRVMRALDSAGVRDRTTVFIVADHGFIATPKSIRPNTILRREGLLTVEGGRIVSGRAVAVSLGGSAMVYLTNPATLPRDREAVLRLFQGAEGIATILEPKDYARYQLPQPSDNQAMGDLFLRAREGYVFSQEATGVDFVVANPNPTAGAHGFLSTDPKMNALFVASGAGIKVGAKCETFENVDVAPTIARLLGVTLENASGHVLEQILTDAK